jgi:ubiquinone/menaquinone biosynthesis C-methylase UbiE
VPPPAFARPAPDLKDAGDRGAGIATAPIPRQYRDTLAMSGSNATLGFYTETLRRLVDAGVFSPNASTLVLAAGLNDRNALADLGFTDVTFSNVDPRLSEADFAPHALTHHHAERIELPDNAVEQIIIANALHHCRSPHRALLEMYRVARRATLAFENRDSALLRLAARFGLVQDYEYDAVVGSGMKYGGVNNSEIPNYVYRWREREIHKTIASFAPELKPRLHYFYSLRSPEDRLRYMQSPLKAMMVRTVFLGVRTLTWMFPSQANLFAFCVEKRDETWPWIRRDAEGYTFNETWARERFNLPTAAE